MHAPRPLAVVAALVVILGASACSGGAASPASPTPTVAPPTPTPVPGAPGAGPVGPGDGGSAGGLGPGPDDPILGNPTYVVPQKGQLDPRPVSVQLIRASVEGRHVQVELRWWSGVAPCSVLDSVRIDRSDGAFTVQVTALEGHGPAEIACIDLAQLTATVVDLGELPAGSWTISAAGDAAPVVVQVG